MNKQLFIDLSEDLTAFSKVDLFGTGFADSYYETTKSIVGEGTLFELLQVYSTLALQAGKDYETRKQSLRSELMASVKFGPIVRNIIKLWYVSTWYELPQSWRDRFGTPANDGTFVVSPWAYAEGLLWDAIGAHPPGAKAPGYATWTAPPRIPEITVGVSS